jgi:parvulin-like peptidyl-prolyl isomerase
MFFLLVIIGAPGCDFFNSVKEYFLEPSQKAESKTKQTVNPQELPVAVQPSLALPIQKNPNPEETIMASNTLARVGGWSITIEEFKRRLDALKEVAPEYDINSLETKQLVLDELINQQILVLGAEKSGMANQKDIGDAVDEFRRTLIVREVARKLTENISVTEEEARAFYQENKDAMVGPAQWHVREIVVPTKEKATEVLTEILKGIDFKEMARQHSLGKTAAQGGDLGFITKEPFPQMGNALLALEVGDVSSVFKGPEGYYIVKLEEKKGGESYNFEDIKKDIIQNQTLMKQQKVILDHIESLKGNTKIEINNALLNK